MPLQSVAEECRARGAADVTVETADVGDDAAVGRIVAATLDRHVRLDAVVHSAGVVAYGRVEDVPVEVFEAVMRTNLLGTANIARHVLPVLRRQRRGDLVLIGSVLGDVATPNMTTYAVSKWAVRALGRQLAVDNRDLPDVHVSVVSPGGVDTPIYESAANYLGVPGRPPPPVTTPERVARAVLRVLDRPRDRRQVGLANGLMRAGFTLMPRLYEALVGPLFAIAALDRTREIPAGPGSVLSPAQPVGRAPGSRRLLPSTTRMTRSVSGVGGLVRAPPGYGQHMWLLAVLILVALVICCMPLPSQPRHRSDRPARAQRGQGLGGRTT